jgi:hypothetical protein
MSSSHELETRTRLFARVLGPYYVIVCGIGLVHAPKTLPILGDFHVWPWDTGAPILMMGLIIVALHPHWTSVAAVVVTVMGWLDTLRGFALLAFPRKFMSMANWLTGPGVQQAVYICLIVVGLYLTYVGWKPEPSRSASNKRQAQ